MSLPKHDIPTRPLDAEQIRAAVRGEDPELSRTSALYLLAGRLDVTDRHLDFQAALEDASAPRMVRYLGALYLGTIDTPESRAILERNLGIEDALVLGRVMRSLAVIGEAGVLPHLGEIRARSSGQLAHEARWAERLLAHRLGVRGHEVHLPPDEGYLELGKRASRELAIHEAGHHERERLARSIAHLPLGIPVRHVYRLECGPRIMLLVLGDRGACSVAGVVVHFHHHDDVYMPIYYLLTCPARASDGVGMTFWSPKGKLVFAGDASPGGDALRFAIRGIASFGVRPIDIAGEVADGRLDLGKRRVGIGVAKRRAAARSR